MEKVSPFGVGQGLGARGFRAPLGNRGEDQRVRPDRCEPVGVTVDVGELWAAGLVMMEDRVHLAGHDLQAVAPEQRPGLIAVHVVAQGLDHRPVGHQALGERHLLGFRLR